MEKNFSLKMPSVIIAKDEKKPSNSIEMEKDAKIDESIKNISKVLNIIEATTENLSFACKKHDWDEGVVYQIQEAATNLGFALATLNRWYDDYDS